MKSSKIDMKEFTKDAFLGGRIQVLQPKCVANQEVQGK